MLGPVFTDYLRFQKMKHRSIIKRPVVALATALVLMGCAASEETKQSLETAPVQSESVTTSEAVKSQENMTTSQMHDENE
jgi:uncharacterized lipoprotein YajG